MIIFKWIGDLYNKGFDLANEWRGIRSLIIMVLMAAIPFALYLFAAFGIGYYVLPTVIPDQFFSLIRDSMKFDPKTEPGTIGFLLALFAPPVCATIGGLFYIIFFKKNRVEIKRTEVKSDVE